MLLTRPMKMSIADNRPEFANLFKLFINSNFHGHVWIQYENALK